MGYGKAKLGMLPHARSIRTSIGNGCTHVYCDGLQLIRATGLGLNYAGEATHQIFAADL
jgi:hypothetical protein